MIEWVVSDVMTCTWRFKRIEAHPDYIVCDDGTAYSTKARQLFGQPDKEKNSFKKLALKPSFVRQGHYKKYYRFRIFSNGKERYLFIHREVCRAFVADPDGLQVNHDDGDTMNNRWWNVRPMTPAENYEDRNKRNGWTKKETAPVPDYLQPELLPETDLPF